MQAKIACYIFLPARAPLPLRRGNLVQPAPRPSPSPSCGPGVTGSRYANPSPTPPPSPLLTGGGVWRCATDSNCSDGSPAIAPRRKRLSCAPRAGYATHAPVMPQRCCVCAGVNGLSGALMGKYFLDSVCLVVSDLLMNYDESDKLLMDDCSTKCEHFEFFPG